MSDFSKVINKLRLVFPEINQLDIKKIFENSKTVKRYLKNKRRSRIVDSVIKLCNFPPKITLKLPKNKEREHVATVVFDMRSSQKILENLKPKEFYDFINKFITSSKTLLFSEKYNGIYDKFTGDGFIVHFSKRISGNDFIQKAVLYSSEIVSKSLSLFNQISNKMVLNYINIMGLSAGVDYGEVTWFRNGAEISVIGKSIVMASRLVSCAKQNEILVNNLVHQKINPNRFNFKKKPIKPKGYKDPFIVFKLKRINPK
jgi:class 3 adenylate cyclase